MDAQTAKEKAIREGTEARRQVKKTIRILIVLIAMGAAILFYYLQ